MAFQFWILLAVSLALGAQSAFRLLRDRFPHPADFAALSTIYYAVPLAAAGFLSFNLRGLVFLHPQAADPGLALVSMRYVVIALVTLRLGVRAAVLIGPPRFLLSFGVDRGAQTRTALWMGGLLAVLALGIFLFGIPEFFSGYASEYYTPVATLGNAIIFSSVEAMGFAVLMALLIGQRFGRVPLKPWIMLVLLALLLVLVVRAKRLEVVSALLPAAVVLMSSGGLLSRPLWRLLLAGSALFVLIVVSAFRVSDGLSWFNLLYYTFTEGVYAGHSLPGIEERLETLSVSYEHGARFLSAILGFVPRFLWEGKDALVYSGNVALEGVSPLGATSFLAEVVLQGGMTAVAIVYGLLGYAFGRIKLFERVWDEGLQTGVLPLRFGIYIVALVIFIPHFRDGIIPAVKLSIQSLIFFILLAGFRYQAARRTRPSVLASAR